MRTIRLESITMIGFRGERERTTTFSPTETTISGANGLGKSRHFDAFLWCLFGKDKEDRKDFEIKTRDADNTTTDKAPCEVTVVLNVDGARTTLRRVYVEEWVKPRGQADEVFRGHHTDCWWNEVPVNITEFKKRVSSIIDEATFKLLTNPEYFSSLKWEDQRAILFQVAKTPSVEMIARSSDEWTSLMEAMKGKSLADFRKELSARKKKLKEKLATIQPKIDATRSLLPEWQDRKTLADKLQEIEREEEELDKAIASASERMRMRDARAQERATRVEALRSKQRKLVADETKRADEEAYASESGRRDLLRAIERATADQKSYRLEVSKLDQLRKGQLDYIATYEAKIEALRAKWIATHEEKYSGDTTCPHCHQTLPEDQIDQARAVWQSAKQARLDEIAKEAEGYKADIEETQVSAHEKEVKIAEYTSKVEELEVELAGMRATLDALPQAEATAPRPAIQLEGYKELEEEIQALLSEEDSDTIETDSIEAYTARRKKLTTLRDDIRLALSKQDQWDEYSKKIKDLGEEGKQLSQQIADAEQEEFKATELAHRQVEECERVINSMFRGVTFKLFDYTIEDRDKEFPFECCIMLVNGVPVGTQNTAMKVTAGLEVIRTLCEHNNVCAPVFIDNRESVQCIPDGLPFQIINLRVSDDKELVVTHNN
nr:MAG TPA: chromosome partition protein [Caudoviricetes sp.]